MSESSEYELLKPAFFVSGVMRSGTTLLHRVVTHSCQSEYIKEVDSFRIIAESFGVLHQHQEYRPLGNRQAYVELYRQFFTSTLNACAQKMYGNTIALKDPLALKVLVFLHELMPTTKFLLSVRNPLGTVTSIFRVRNRQCEQGKQSFISQMDFGDIVNYVEKLCDVIIAMKEKENVCVVRYEDLVMRHSNVLQKLKIFVGVDINIELEDTSSEYDPEHGFWTPESGGPIAQSSLNKYQNELNAEQIDLVKSRFLHFKQLFGYAV